MAAEERESNQSANPRSAPDIQGLPQLSCRAIKKSFDIRKGSKTAYREIAQQSGVEAVLDINLYPRPIRFEVNDMDCVTALGLAGATEFWRPPTSSRFFVSGAIASRTWPIQILQRTMRDSQQKPIRLTLGEAPDVAQ